MTSDCFHVTQSRIARLAGACALAAFLGAGAAGAETAAPPPGPAPAPAYDEGLLRLSEILGAVHYLRQLCGANEGSAWRNQMAALIDSEQPDADRRARLIDRFNRGYESFRAVYVACTPAAIVVIDRYMDEGAKIARDIAARYGKEQ